MVINDGKVVAHHFISQSSLKKLTDYFENSNTAYYLQTQNFLVSKNGASTARFRSLISLDTPKRIY